MNKIQIFSNTEFGKMRTLMIDGEPWFVGKDVAEALGYGNGNSKSKSIANAIKDHVDTEDKGVTKMMTPGGTQQVTIINESGLYSLILSSKLPSAKRFKRWITSEVLPALIGSETETDTDTDEDAEAVEAVEDPEVLDGNEEQEAEYTNNIQIFSNTEFGKMRTLMIDGEPWFVGKDVAIALGYSNASKAVSCHVDREDLQYIMLNIADSHFGNLPIGKTKTAIINESGLYSLILSSKLPSAKRFKRWITSEVLPALIGSETETDTDEDTEAVEDPEVLDSDEEQEEAYTNNIQIFSNAEFGKIRTVMLDGEPWFVGKDVARELGYSDVNKAIAMHVDTEDKKLNDKTSLSFGQRGATLINESGLYSLILSSKLPSAKRFKRWITSEVLPTLRKNGTYTLAAAEEKVEEPKPKPRATRPLTSDDYIKAADIISRCRNTRLAIAMDLLEKAGLDLPKIPVPTAAAMDEPSAFDTERTRAQMEREMRIMEFVQRKVPRDWSSWSLDRRKKFWQDYEDGESDDIELVDRNRICAMEIWQELFGKPAGDLKNMNAREINAILAHIAGFEKTKNPVWCGPYKSQRAFIIVEL